MLVSCILGHISHIYRYGFVLFHELSGGQVIYFMTCVNEVRIVCDVVLHFRIFLFFFCPCLGYSRVDNESLLITHLVPTFHGI